MGAWDRGLLGAPAGAACRARSPLLPGSCTAAAPWCPPHPSPLEGLTAENVAERFGVPREVQDRWAARSHQKAAEAAVGAVGQGVSGPGWVQLSLGLAAAGPVGPGVSWPG